MSNDGGARREAIPDQRSLADRLGPALEQWDTLARHLTEDVGATGAWSWGGSRSGWELRFKRAGRPLTTLTPGNGEFTALVVLGREEALRASALRLGERARRTFEDAHAYHDGRWLFLGVAGDDDLEDFRVLVREKLPARLRASLRPMVGAAAT